MLEFDEAKHKYKLDGKSIPCVSDICRFLSREVYGEVNKVAMDQAADRGTRVHAATEEYDKQGICTVDEDIAGYLKAYSAFKKEHAVKWNLSEYMGCFIWKKDFPVAGRFDREGRIDNDDVIVDIKTTSEITKKHQLLYGIQLQMYKFIFDKIYEGLHPSIIPDRKLIVLHLMKDGTYELIDVKNDQTVSAAMSCLDLAYALKEITKRGKKNG